MDAKTYLIEHLPERFRESVRYFSRQKEWTELRMRTGAVLAAVASDGNYLLGERGIKRNGERGILCRDADLSETVAGLCEGSGYRYFDTLAYGYVTLDQGIRLGIAGEKRGTGSRLPEELTALSIRLPGIYPEAADPYLNAVRGRALVSTLVLSPPGGGKTTFLRALATRLSAGYAGRSPLRVAVADERRELFPAVLARGNCDVLSGIPKAEGIRRAIRLFSPQVLICDEIGTETDVQAIKEAGSSGVIFFASCHAASTEQALARPGIRDLVENGVMQSFVVLTPVPGPRMKIDFQIAAPC